VREKASDHYRFYLTSGSIDSAGEVAFPESESSHMKASLRIGAGEIVSATDGRGRVFKVSVERFAGKRAVGRVVEVRELESPVPRIHLYQGMIRAPRMDVVVEKCTELGVAAFTPVRTERSVRRLSGDRLERLSRIAVESMKQSLGAHLPRMEAPAAFDDAIAGLGGFDLTLAAHEGEAATTLAGAARGASPKRSPGARIETIALWIGPEGGLTDTEISSLVGKGAVTFSLGERRLKAETAAIASVAALQQLFPGR
jgi:16S rRNA (uracil1498-N3)-methyltransferase